MTGVLLAGLTALWTLISWLLLALAVVVAIHIGRLLWPAPARLAVLLMTLGAIAVWGGALQDLALRQDGATVLETEQAPRPDTPEAKCLPASAPPAAGAAAAGAAAEAPFAVSQGRSCHEGAVTLKAFEIARNASRVNFGRVELMQMVPRSARPAEPKSLSLTHDADRPGLSGWSLTNLSAERRLLLSYCDMHDPVAGAACLHDHTGTIKLRSDRLPIEPGDIVEFSSESGAAEQLRIGAVTSGLDENPRRNAGTLTFEIFRPGEILRPGEPADRRFELRWSASDFSLRDSRGHAPKACSDSGWALLSDLRTLNRKLRAFGRETTAEQMLLHIGGQASCINKDGVAAIALSGASYSALAIGFVPNVGFVFIRDADPGLRIIRAGQPIWLGGLAHPLVDRMAGRAVTLEGFFTGRSRYGIESPESDQSPVAMSIVPVADADRLAGFDCVAAATVDFVGQPGHPSQIFCADAPRAAAVWRDPGTTLATLPSVARRHVMGIARLAAAKGSGLVRRLGFGATAGLLAGLGAVLALGWRFGPSFSGRLVEGPLAFESLLRWSLIGLGTLVVCDFVAWKIDPDIASGWMHGAPKLVPDSPWGLLYVWALAAVAVATARGGGLLDGCVLLVTTAIVALGHCALMAMSLDASELRRLRFADDTTHALTAAAALIVVLSQMGPRVLAGAARRLVGAPILWRLPVGLWILTLAMVFVLLAWVALGTETGIDGALQPSEIVKTLMVLLLSAAVTLALDRERGSLAGLLLSRRIGAPSGSRGWAHRCLPFCASGLGAIGLGTLGLSLRGSLGHLLVPQDMIELASILLMLAGGGVVMSRIGDPLWSSFIVIAGVMATILLVPVFRNDLSPFLIIAITALTTLVVVVIIHGTALLSESLDERRFNVPPPPQSWRPPQAANLGPSPGLDRIVSLHLYRVTRASLRGVWRRPFELFAGVGLLLMVGLAALAWSQIAEARLSREALVEKIGDWSDKPIGRLVSWIEFNARPEADGHAIAVEFLDVGLQVARSRLAIAASRCSDWQAWRVDGRQASSASGGAIAEALAALRGTAQLPGLLAMRAAAMVGAREGCDTGLGSGSPQDAFKRESSVIDMPEIHNDFIGTWLIVSLGRMGSAELVVLQCGLVVLMIFCAFRTVKWTRAHVHNRPAASVAAFAVIGFSLMMATQWAISWANALGIVPVMGQPATFLSHGPSHLLFFGVPAILTTLAALRLRSALTILPADDRLPQVPWTRIGRHGSRRRTKKLTRRRTVIR